MYVVYSGGFKRGGGFGYTYLEIPCLKAQAII